MPLRILTKNQNDISLKNHLLRKMSGEFSRKINKCIRQSEWDLRAVVDYRLAENLEEGKCYKTYELICRQKVLIFSLYFLFFPVSRF